MGLRSQQLLWGNLNVLARYISILVIKSLLSVFPTKTAWTNFFFFLSFSFFFFCPWKKRSDWVNLYIEYLFPRTTFANALLDSNACIRVLVT